MGNIFQDLEFLFQHLNGDHFEKENGTKRPFLVYCGFLSVIKQPKMVQSIRYKIQNYNTYMENNFQDL